MNCEHVGKITKVDSIETKSKTKNKTMTLFMSVKTLNEDVNKQLEKEVLEIQNFMGEREKDIL